MFFGLFKRAPAPAAKAKATAPKRRPARQPADAHLPPEPTSLEVTEGSDHTDWALWEDSVALDSRMDSLQPSVKLYRREDETPTEIQDIEAFARVRHKDP